MWHLACMDKDMRAIRPFGTPHTDNHPLLPHCREGYDAMLTQLTARIKDHWRERRQRSRQGYHDYLEFWRSYYVR
jgi:hypothetical protein